jgi:3-hydroxy-D-aspartate aldolase
VDGYAAATGAVNAVGMTREGPPAAAGMAIEEVDTPALLVDLDALEYNIDRMAGAAAAAHVRLRPHAKSHKCAQIALLQVASGAVGICCQKVSEAESMVVGARGGVGDVLVSNEIVDPRKLSRLAALAMRARLSVCADDAGAVDALNAAAAEYAVTIGVLVEIDAGGDRCGVDPGEPALRLAGHIASKSHLRFGGLQAYQGRAQHIRVASEREGAARAAASAAGRTRDLLARHGIPCGVITGGGTGTWPQDAASGVYTELQAGSYIFMDADYRANRTAEGGDYREFRQSLFIYTQVMSMPGRHYVVLDAGLKAVAVDEGMPVPDGLPGVPYVRPSDEHGMLDVRATPRVLRLGEKLRLVPGHCDPTVNLYEWLVAVRGDQVEAVWPVVARGVGR